MLDIALQFLKDELNSYIVARAGSASIEVKLTKMVDDTGKYAFLEQEVGVSLINIEEERVVREHLPRYSTANNQRIVQEPELRLNLYLIFAANFTQYDQALKCLSLIMAFFQSHPVFTVSRYPALDSRIDKLVVELQTLSYEQINQVWASIGARQLPALIYKVRMVIIRDAEPELAGPPITTIATTMKGQ